MKNAVIILAAAAFSLLASAAPKSRTLSVKSPDGATEVTVTVAESISYDVTRDGQTLMKGNKVALRLSDRTLGESPAIKSSKVTSVRETIRPDFKLKYAEVDNTYNLLTVAFKGGYSILWRVYDDGVAYRFETSLPGQVEVMEEVADLNMSGAASIVGQVTDSFKTSCEQKYERVDAGALESRGDMWELPFVAEYPGMKVLVSEFDLEDYPALLMKASGKGSLSAIHPKSPTAFEDDDDRTVRFLGQTDWIASTTGTRAYPWRYMLITSDDRRLAENRMSVRLAPKSRLEDTSWITRGQTTWDWLNGIPYGPGIDFKGGINLDTYKYCADFAAKNGVKYILLDEGWALDTRNPYETNPEVHIHDLISYAGSKGVGVILWLPWLTVENNMDKMFATFEEWGIKGVKIDFMDRMDQWMIDFYERVAKESSKHHIFVDFHGAFHPSGLEYRYPNILTYEGVRGLEYCSSCTPDNTLYQPYIRNAAGPMDFTPGMMDCRQPEVYSGGRPMTPAVGTKSSQLAQVVAFETGLQMLADNPCRYDMYPECRDFMCGVPVEWDDTKVLAGEMGLYYVVAKRSGDTWYIAGLNNSTARDVTVDLSFLGDGQDWKITAFTDGPVADQIAMDYRCTESGVQGGASLSIHMARNGGYAAVLTR